MYIYTYIYTYTYISTHMLCISPEIGGGDSCFGVPRSATTTTTTTTTNDINHNDWVWG